MTKLLKKGTVLTIAIMGVMCLTGCDKKQVKYTTEVTEEVIQEEIEADIPSTISYEVMDVGGTIKVDAQIILPDNYDKCSVIEFSKIEFTDEDIKAMADKVFDDDSFFLYMPYSQVEIEAMRDKLTSIADATTDPREKANISQELYNLEQRLNNPDLDFETVEDIKFYSIPPEYEWSSIEEGCCLIGTIEGKYYYLSFSKSHGDTTITLQVLRDLNKLDANQNLGPDSLDVQLEGNSCAYSAEEAQKLATEYIEKLGYTEYEPIVINHCKENDYGVNSDTRKVNSYNIYFGRKVDGYKVSFNSANYHSGFVDAATTSGLYNSGVAMEYVLVNVCDDGVSQVVIFNPMKQEQVLNDHVNLLPFHQIDAQARDAFASYVSETYEGRPPRMKTITEIELGYGYTYDDKTDRYALIPVWYYIVGDRSQETTYSRAVWAAYNAMDGTAKDDVSVRIESY